MDSDDDFNSSMSGEDFEDQDSDLGLEDGMYLGFLIRGPAFAKEPL
jgi:hypothetical protein